MISNSAGESGESTKEKSGPTTSMSPPPTKKTFQLSFNTDDSDKPWRNDIVELRGRVSLLLSKIQEKEKSDLQTFEMWKEGIDEQGVLVQGNTSTIAEFGKEMLKLRDRADLLDGRLNIIDRELESLIAWTGFRNDETNSYRKFQEKRNSMAKPVRPLKTGKAGVQVILVEDEESEDSWELPNVTFEDEIGYGRTEGSTNEEDLEASRRLNVDTVTFLKNPETNKFCCPACSKEFVNKKDMRRHYRIHSGEKPHACSFCPKKFPRKDQLNSHMTRKHNGMDTKNDTDELSTDFTQEMASIEEDPREPDSSDLDYDSAKRNDEDLDGDPNDTVTFFKNSETNKFCCPACSKEFVNMKDMRRHYRIHSGEKPHACCFCPSKFPRKDQLNSHMTRKHTGMDGINDTEELPPDFSQEATSSNMVSIEEEDPKEPDSDPDYDPTPVTKPVKRGRGRPRKHPISNETLAKPVKPAKSKRASELPSVTIGLDETAIQMTQRNPETNKFDCSACVKSFGNRRDLLRHFRLHTGEKPFKCTAPGCSQSFSRQDKLLVHERKHHTKSDQSEGVPAKKIKLVEQCSKCPEVFQNRQKALRHLATHDKVKISTPKDPNIRHQCPSCDSSYTKKEKLNYHIRVIHGLSEGEASGAKELFECPECNKKFGEKKYMDRHLIGCRGLRPFACSECTRTFTQNSTLIQHKAAVHRGVKRYLCAECGKGFYTSGNYKKHMRGHRNERIYKCQLCDKAFVGLSDLRSHEAIHRGIRKHSCPDCPLKFFRRYTLIRHQRVHTGEKPYMCDICGAAFTQGGTLKTHKEKHSLVEKKWQPPKTKGKKYRVQPQPELANDESERQAEDSTVETAYILQAQEPSHPQSHPIAIDLNPAYSTFATTHHQQFSVQPNPNYETVDFVSIFQRFDGC